MSQIIKDEKKYMMQTYKRHDLVVKKARGVNLWDEDGKKYLDFFAGISVCNLGHCHPRVVAAIKKQAGSFIHVSNHYYVAAQADLAKALVKATFPGRVFLSNSGAEANEGAIKLARKWGNSRFGSVKKNVIISFKNSFHGRTLTTLAATGQAKFHAGFEPLPKGFVFAEFNNLESVKKLITKETAAILVEPVQGEGGVVPATPEFLKGLRALCDKNKMLLIFDEVQTGYGRIGTLFAFQQYGVKPDVLTVAKGIAGGLPLGAIIATEAASSAFAFGDHGTTFGGNPVACAAALEVLKLTSPSLLAQSRKNGEYFKAGLEELASRFSFVKEVRGKGLFLGMVLDLPGGDIVQWCQQHGLIINCTQNTVLRFLPPLIVTKKDIDTALNLLEVALSWQASRR